MSTEIIHGYWQKTQWNQWGFVDRQMRSYTGIFIHFISNSKLHNVELACRRSNGHHTAGNIV